MYAHNTECVAELP